MHDIVVDTTTIQCHSNSVEMFVEEKFSLRSVDPKRENFTHIHINTVFVIIICSMGS